MSKILYGNKELAEMLGWTQQKTHTYYKRGKFEQPEFLVGERPAWTKEQVERITKGEIKPSSSTPIAPLQKIDELDDFDDLNDFEWDFKRDETPAESQEDEEDPLDNFFAAMNK